jgi:hypothetical protein
MPRKKKSPNEMTTEELARFVFPKKVVEEAKRIAHENDEKKPPKAEPKKKS